MRFFDWLFGSNITPWDERAIGRGIVYGDTLKKDFKRNWEALMREEEEKRRKEREPGLALAREYNKSFMMINRDAGQIFGGIDKTPMLKPLFLTADQRVVLLELIDEYAATRKIPAAHAKRMKEYLHWMFEMRKPR